MAKAAQKRKERSSPSAAPTGMLALAFKAYEAGDMVLARRAAERVRNGLPTAADAAAAQQLAPQIFSPDALAELKARPSQAPSMTPEQVAAELISRTRGPSQVYLFALVGALLVAVMISLAVYRSTHG